MKTKVDRMGNTEREGGRERRIERDGEGERSEEYQ
jgi:hypothetical protein